MWARFINALYVAIFANESVHIVLALPHELPPTINHQSIEIPILFLKVLSQQAAFLLIQEL